MAALSYGIDAIADAFYGNLELPARDKVVLSPDAEISTPYCLKRGSLEFPRASDPSWKAGRFPISISPLFHPWQYRLPDVSGTG